MATLIRYKTTGHKRLVADFAARRLVANGIATLVSDELPPAPEQKAETAPPVPPAPPEESAADGAADDAGSPPPDTTDGLDALDAAELRALAEERGLKVHHRAGADKLRALLRGEG